MMDMEGIATTLAGLVPTGKNLAWLLAAGVSMFFAGVGFTISARAGDGCSCPWSTLPAKRKIPTVCQ